MTDNSPDYYKGGLDAILELLDGIDDGWDLEAVTNHCEIEVARLARARDGQKPIEVKRPPKTSWSGAWD
jgi:hypothetical protein